MLEEEANNELTQQCLLVAGHQQHACNNTTVWKIAKNYSKFQDKWVQFSTNEQQQLFCYHSASVKSTHEMTRIQENG